MIRPRVRRFDLILLLARSAAIIASLRTLAREHRN